MFLLSQLKLNKFKLFFRKVSINYHVRTNRTKIKYLRNGTTYQGSKYVNCGEFHSIWDFVGIEAMWGKCEDSIILPFF